MNSRFLHLLIDSLTNDGAFLVWETERNNEDAPDEAEVLSFYMRSDDEPVDGEEGASPRTEEEREPLLFLTSKSKMLEDLAKKYLAGDIRVFAENSEDYYRILKGIGYLNENDFTAALICFEGAINLNESNVLAHYFCGLACQKAEDHNKALTYFEKMIELAEIKKPMARLQGTSPQPQDVPQLKSKQKRSRISSKAVKPLEESIKLPMFDKTKQKPQPQKKYQFLVAEIFLYLAIREEVQGNLEKAENYYSIAKKLTSRENPIQRIFILEKRADIRLQRENFDCINDLNSAIVCMHKVRDKSSLPRLAAKLEIAKRRRNEFLIANISLKLTGGKTDPVDLLEIRAKAFEEIGNFASALDDYRNILSQIIRGSRQYTEIQEKIVLLQSSLSLPPIQLSPDRSILKRARAAGTAVEPTAQKRVRFQITHDPSSLPSLQYSARYQFYAERQSIAVEEKEIKEHNRDDKEPSHDPEAHPWQSLDY